MDNINDIHYYVYSLYAITKLFNFLLFIQGLIY